MATTIRYSLLLNFLFFTLSFGQLPNLVVPSGSFSPSSISRGGLLTITATVQNYGIGNSVKSHLYVYLSTSTNVSSGFLLGCISVEPLAAGASSEPKEISISVPTSMSPGTYYVGWVVDPFNEVIESDENNGFYLSSPTLTITSEFVFGRHIPYPIIFIHGWIRINPSCPTHHGRKHLFTFFISERKRCRGEFPKVLSFN